MFIFNIHRLSTWISSLTHVHVYDRVGLLNTGMYTTGGSRSSGLNDILTLLSKQKGDGIITNDVNLYSKRCLNSQRFKSEITIKPKSKPT